MKHLIIFAPLLLLATAAHAGPVEGEEVITPNEKQLNQIRQLTPASVESSILVEDDSLEAIAKLTSENVWKGKGKFTDKVRSDNFLRAFIDKRSGEVRYQLYQEVTYSGDWRRFSSVSYETAEGPIMAQTTSIAQQVVTCDYGLCVHREVVGFDVPRTVLDEVAARYTITEEVVFWRFRFKGQGGLDWEDRISAAEVVGFLQAVDRRIGHR